MPKRKLLVAPAGLAVVLTAGLIVMWPRQDRITKANYDRIHTGMTRTEVETILGPPGFHATGKLAPVGTLIPVPGRIDTKDEFWQGDTIIIYLYFDSSGSVVDKDYREVRRVPQGLIDSFRFRLEQQKRQRDYLEEDSPPQQAGGSKR